MTSDTLLVTFSNYGVESIFTTSDGGSNWDSRDFNLPDMPVRSSILHPNSSNHALIATEIGVWETNNLFQNNTYWYPHNNLANVRVDMLAMRADGSMSAGTHGRGMFSSTWFTSTAPLNAAFSSNENTSIWYVW